VKLRDLIKRLQELNATLEEMDIEADVAILDEEGEAWEIRESEDLKDDIHWDSNNECVFINIILDA
jgi:hypothetical protein